ncbi:AraC family transcriptional regulator [Allorhizobium sp. BGMRC 0089]|uniref:AraC family transcriptional regulator n=1 Tax=Allorhizobium sonneratiae TaxID=2934936 RepID=UPI0020339E13|nr:AraC family transcriptional regulator [Allorhizobium sonneratiae]MCM2292033.1 AraC family transcriptional regulator [Allorhizobium sonneratiae]
MDSYFLTRLYRDTSPPLREEVEFWRDERLSGMECMTASFLTHRFAPHAHEHFGIGAMEMGRKRATIRGCRDVAGPGDLYLINPEEMHDAAVDTGGCRYRMIYPSVSLARSILNDAGEQCFSGTPFFAKQLLSDPGLAMAFLQTHRQLQAGVSDLEAGERMFSLLTMIFRRHGQSGVEVRPYRDHRAARRLRDYLDAHFAEEVSLEALAASVDLSRAHMIRAFRACWNITPHAYQTHLRVRQAKKLMGEGREIAEVAFLCGFADQAHLTRQFKTRTGLTPGQYRRAVLVI